MISSRKKRGKKMNNGLCPECGCEMDRSEEVFSLDDYDEQPVIEVTYVCLCCEYFETTIED